MATSTTINIRIDANLKKKATIIADDLGMSLSAILKTLLFDFVENKSKIRLVYESELAPETLSILKEAESEIEYGNVSPSFDNPKDAIKWLNKNSKTFGK